MANIFAAITAVLLAAAAFVAWKNQQAFEQEISDSETEKSRLDTSRERLATLRANRDATIEERTGVEEDTVAKQAIEAERKEGNDKLTGDIASKREEVSENARQIAEIEEKTKESGELRDLADKIRRMKTEIAGLEDDKVGKEARLANLLSVKNSTETTIGGYREIDRSFARQSSYFKSARISSIFAQWGFVTINVGNTGGVVTNSTLDVVRDGEVIAKLRVRSVESSRASADIVPGSLSEDTTLMVGDQVVPSAVAEEPAPPPAAAGDEQDVEDAAPGADVPAGEEEDADELDFDF